MTGCAAFMSAPVCYFIIMCVCTDSFVCVLELELQPSAINRLVDQK